MTTTIETFRSREEQEFFQVERKCSADSRVDYAKARKKPQIAAVLAVHVGVFLFGCSIGWSSPVQHQLTRNDTLDAELLGPWLIILTEDEMSWLGSLLAMGAVVGAMIGWPLMDCLGRKGILMTVTLPSSCGWVLIGLAQNKSVLYSGRFFCGFAGGICSVAASSYVAEISTPDMRESLNMVFPIFISVGCLTSSLLGFLPWRWMTFIYCVISFLVFGVMLFVPETPYFLLSNRRQRIGAKTALQWLRGADYDIEPEMEIIEAEVKADLEHVSHFDQFFLPWIYRPVYVSLGLVLCQQLCGINAILFYTVEIFRLTECKFEILLCGLNLSVVLVGMVFQSALLVKCISRRIMFAASGMLTSISLSALGTHFYLKENDPDMAEHLYWLPLTSLILFMAGFSFGLGPLPWLITNEILPSEFRQPGSSIATSVQWMVAFVVTKTFASLKVLMGPAGLFWMFGSFSFLSVVFGLFILPETKGKTCDQIRAIFER